MAKFSLTKRAMADLVDIGRYTEEHWGFEQRNKYLTMLDSCFHDLAEKPAEGRDCSDIRHGYRKINVGSHVVFYRQKQSDEIEIVRVLHGRMDLETKL
ncbi:MAG: type II toxin-antitoxin system RelE/ParE family toxin [Pseudomonadota bacterium]